MPKTTFQLQYRYGPDRTLVVMHSGRIAPFVLSVSGRLDRRQALDALASYLESLALLARRDSE